MKRASKKRSRTKKIKKKKPASRDHESQVEKDEEGIELEQVSSDTTIKEPFDPTGIRVTTRPISMDLLLARMANEELDLSPGFQRREGIWNNKAKSQLIESILLRIPLPAFYLDATNDHWWQVVDGLQRLSTLKSFVIEKTLKLSRLEFLSELEGLGFDELDRAFQRRIRETQVTVYLIEEGTPPQVKFNIFKRINTGGLPLSSQEIRHALNQGSSTSLLEKLALSDEFKRATDYGISEKRMGDRECVLRFLAFTLTPPNRYDAKDFDGFLNETMQQLNKMSKQALDELALKFSRVMDVAYKLHGKHTFRKMYTPNSTYRFPINKALFEAWSVNLARLTDRDLKRLVTNRESLQRSFCKLMQQDREFESSVSQGTGDIPKVRRRFREIDKIIRKALK